MSSNVVECDVSERERQPGECVCSGGPTLSILQEVQHAYEERMALIERFGGANKLQMEVEVLRGWVGDLSSQNTLLARAVEELETEATSHLLLVKRQHSEKEKKRTLYGNPNELKTLNDTLHKENVSKDREIRRLNKDVQHFEQVIINLRNELSLINQQNPNVSKKDAEVMAGTCCTGNECGDWEPVRECSVSPKETTDYQERMQKMEANLKASSCNVRALRKINAELSDELAALRRVCVTLQEQCRAVALHAQFKDDIIREMRRQLHQAKTKLKELSDPKRGVSSESSRDYELQRCERSAAESPSPHLEGEAAAGVEELYFNNWAKSDPSVLGKSVTDQECKQKINSCRPCKNASTRPEARSVPLCKIMQESGGGSSAADAGSGAWDAEARAHYYHNKLLSTLQVLQNKEETVRVQNESLRVAEARIARLSARADCLRAQLDHKGAQLRSAQRSGRCGAERADVSTSTEAQVDCTCGLDEENMRLKSINESLEIQLGELRQKLSDLETTLLEKEDAEKYKTEIEDKNKELKIIRERVQVLKRSVADKEAACAAITTQLEQAQASLERAARRAAVHEAARLQQPPDESAALRERLALEVAAAAERERRATKQYRHLEQIYRQQCRCAWWLQQQLEEAQARGVMLCADVRAALHDARRTLTLHRDQESKIKEQERLIDSLQRKLKSSRKHEDTKTEDDACCPNCVSFRRKRCSAYASEVASCSKRASNVRERCRACSRTSGSERGSPSSVPTPPQRLTKENTFPCTVTEWLGCSRGAQRCSRSPQVQEEQRGVSASSELEKMERALQMALHRSEFAPAPPHV